MVLSVEAIVAIVNLVVAAPCTVVLVWQLFRPQERSIEGYCKSSPAANVTWPMHYQYSDHNYKAGVRMSRLSYYRASEGVMMKNQLDINVETGYFEVAIAEAYL